MINKNKFVIHSYLKNKTKEILLLKDQFLK